MKLREALQIKREAATRAGPPFTAFLATGAVPLHLHTLLVAQLARRLPNRSVQCLTGPYGDLLEALGAAETAEPHGIAVVIEYRDLDPRLGLRRLGGWTADSLNDAVDQAERRLNRLETLLARFGGTPLAIALPTLALPPLFSPPRGQASALELKLRKLVDDFALAASSAPNVIITSGAELDRVSPSAARHDVRSELMADFPYAVDHAAALADILARSLAPSPPLKGLITDLDDTLWRGLVGEIGSDKVSWSLEDGSQGHGLYQQLLGSLADSGTLIAIASKNDPASVEPALRRKDLLVHPDRLYPIDVGWHAKSESVARILARWNIGADAVMFVDDSPLEVAEVQARFPGMRAAVFPVGRDDEILGFLGGLRDLFGKAVVSAEDKLRADSIRASAAGAAAVAGAAGSPEAFLAEIDAELDLDFAKALSDERAFELINKTNQFNLNGRRLEASEWRRFLERPDSFVVVASYRDKFGPLGRISVAFGSHGDGQLRIDGWVLSCRAFARRVEHAILDSLFERFGVEQIGAAFAATGRNTVTADFLAELGVDMAASPVVITRSSFTARRPALHHRRTVLGNAPLSSRPCPVSA